MALEKIKLYYILIGKKLGTRYNREFKSGGKNKYNVKF